MTHWVGTLSVQAFKPPAPMEKAGMVVCALRELTGQPAEPNDKLSSGLVRIPVLRKHDRGRNQTSFPGLHMITYVHTHEHAQTHTYIHIPHEHLQHTHSIN